MKTLCINEKALLKEAISAIQANDDRCVVVLGQNDVVLGVFSEGDVLRAVLAGREMHAPIKYLIRPNFTYLNKYCKRELLNIFKKGHTLIPIVDKDFRLLNIITLINFLNEEHNG